MIGPVGTTAEQWGSGPASTAGPSPPAPVAPARVAPAPAPPAPPLLPPLAPVDPPALLIGSRGGNVLLEPPALRSPPQSANSKLPLLTLDISLPLSMRA